jgi:hypothetical protein
LSIDGSDPPHHNPYLVAALVRMLKINELPTELEYLMSDAIRDVEQARQYIVVYPNEVKKTALKGHVVLPDGTINAPEFCLEDFTTVLCRKIVEKKFSMRKSMKKSDIQRELYIMKTGEVSLPADDDDDNSKAFARHCIVVNRFIGLIFGPEYKDQLEEITKRKVRNDHECGAGSNDQNFYEKLAEIINDNKHDAHRFYLPFDAPCKDKHPDYCNYMESYSAEECQSNETITTTTWRDLKDILAYLMKVYDVMDENYTKSGDSSGLAIP